MKEASESRIIELLDAGWRLFGTPHMRGPKGNIVQVHRGTFKRMLKNNKIKSVDSRTSHEYIKVILPSQPSEQT